jgi:NTP pyrophosphatase (non-canonical NTP hydrolase)
MEISVNVNNYIELASRTNQPDYAAVQKRLDEQYIQDSLPSLIQATAHVLDTTMDGVKKFLFYGKPLSPEASASLLGYGYANTDQADELSEAEIDILHGALGISTEAGEILKAIQGNGPLDMVNLAEEVGDILWYAHLILKRANMTFEQCMSININKLAKRFPDGFKEEPAIHRDIASERNILEQGVNESAHHFAD